MYQRVLISFLQKEKYLFVIVLLINLVLILSKEFYPSMDGPAHLHNSFLLKQLLGGSDFVKQYYTINTMPIPNWTLHAMLTLFLTIVSPALAEKLPYVVYVLLLAFSFRYFIKQIQPANLLGATLVFPFLFSFLLHLGFLNFCISIGFMFLGLGYYLKNNSHINFKSGLALSVIILLTYFSNVLGFVYLLLLLFAFSVVDHFKNTQKTTKGEIINFIKRSLVLGLISIVPLVFLVIFYRGVTFFPSNFDYKRQELLDWIYNIRPLIVYVFNEDKEYTQFLFFLLVVAFSISAFNFYNKEQKLKLSISLVLLFVLVITFVLLLVVPDGSSAGMMSDRLALMLFFILLAALLSFPIPRTILVFVTLGAVFVNFSIYHYNHKRIIKNYSEHAAKMFALTDKIKDKSILLPVNMGADWIEIHFSNYCGTNKEVIVLENYEASVGWFPLKSDIDKLPKFMLGSKTNASNLWWRTNLDSKTEKKIDYVLLFGNPSKLDQPEFAELKTELSAAYSLIDGTDPYIKLYKLN